MNIGLYVAATWATPHLIAAAAAAERTGTHPCFLFSNSGLYDHPIADFFSLSMQKAAQLNFTGSLSQVLGPQGVHVASVNIGGIISESDPVINAGNIAASFGKLYEQKQPDWEFSVDVGDIRDLIKRMSGQ